MKQKAFLILAIVGIVLVSGCIGERNVSSDPKETGDSMSLPLDVQLSLEGIPSLNQEVKLNVVITSFIKAPNTTTRIFLPEGFAAVNEEALSWTDNIPSGGKAEHSVTIRAIKTDIWEIKAASLLNKGSEVLPSPTNSPFQDSLRVKIGETTGEIVIPQKNDTEIKTNQKLTQLDDV